MKDLAAARNLELFTNFHSNIAGSFKYWCKIYVEKHCKKKKDNKLQICTILQRLNAIISKLINVIKHLQTQYSSEDPDINDTASSISDEDIDTPDNFIQHLEMNEWLERFHESVKRQ